MAIALGQIRAALEGAIPAVLATVSHDGEPNVAFLSQVHYVDERHVALSYQFFNKTRRNILANPHGHLMVVDPQTAQIYRMRLSYLRTESDTALFQRMKAHLEGIASHTGMAGVFHLLGSDVYEVSELEVLPSQRTLSAPAKPLNQLAALRRSSEALAQCSDVGALVDVALDSLVNEFAVEHAMFLAHDQRGQRLFLVGSRGYAATGVGSEIAMGDGVIGVCAQARAPIRISWLTQAYRYSRAIRDATVQDGQGRTIRSEIPYPGLAEPHSQLGLPIVRGQHLLGVLFVESPVDLRFTYDDEDALVALAAQLGASMVALDAASDNEPERGVPPAEPAPLRTVADVLAVRHFTENDSVFFGDQYLIKGVAGAILWMMLSEYQANGRREFSNREIRLDPRVRMPDVVDNLDARLILLRKRLAEQDFGIALHKVGRGRLRLAVGRALDLSEISPG